MLDLGSASRYRGRDVRLWFLCAAAGVRRADRIIRYDLAAVLRTLYTAVPRYYPGTRNSGPVGTCDSLLSQHILYVIVQVPLVSIPATHTNAPPPYLRNRSTAYRSSARNDQQTASLFAAAFRICVGRRCGAP